MIGLSVVNSSSKLAFAQAARMLAGRLEAHDILDEVDDANLQVGQFAADVDRRPAFRPSARRRSRPSPRRLVPRSLLAHSQMPMPEVQWQDRLLHVQPLVFGLLADANTLLSVTDHCLRSRNYVNVIVAGKQPDTSG